MRRKLTRRALERFMREFAAAAKSPGKVYFTGGATALLLGFREQTIDLGLKLDPEWSFRSRKPGRVSEQARELSLTDGMNPESKTTLLPGGDLIEQVLADLRRGEMTECSLLVLIAAPRLRRRGLKIPDAPPCAQAFAHELYERIEQRLGASAYSHYNALLRRITSFVSALEREHARG